MTWWRVNRWWLVALPVAVAVMVLGTAWRVNTYWWENGYHQELAVADQGEWIEVVNHYADPHGDAVRKFQVRLLGLEEVDEVPLKFDDPVSPRGMQGYQVRLAFRAEPDVPLGYCLVGLRDARGRQYGGDTGDKLDQGSSCVPLDTPGPSVPVTADTPRGVMVPGQERPQEWTVTIPALAAEDARLTEVRLMWQWNEYVTLRLTD